MQYVSIIKSFVRPSRSLWIILVGGIIAISTILAILHTSHDLFDPEIKSRTKAVLADSSTPNVLQLESGQLKHEYISPKFETKFEFNALAPHWEEEDANSETHRHIDIRVSDDGEEWTDWIRLEAGSPMRRNTPNNAQVAPETPLMLEGRHFQYRMKLERSSLAEISPRIKNLEFNYIDSRQSRLQEMGQSIEALGAKVSASSNDGADVVSRADWGNPDPYGKEFKGTDKFWPPYQESVDQIFLHHTVTDSQDSSPEATMRAIWDYHANTLGWGDIGYNYVVDPNGTIYEGRFGGDNVTGGHVLNYNQGSLGIAVLGCYQPGSTCDEINSGATGPPSDAAIDGLTTLLSWKTTSFEIDPQTTQEFCNYRGGDCLQLDTISGHRDAGDTSCNGDYFYNEHPTIRQQTQDKNNETPWPYSAKQQSYELIELYDKTAEVTLAFKNTGAETWGDDETMQLKTANPAGRFSDFQGSDWVDRNTPAELNEGTVSSGESGSFTFEIARSQVDKDYSHESFSLAPASSSQLESFYTTWIEPSLAHPDGTLIQKPGNPRVYLMENGQRRAIPTREIFESWRFRFSNVREATSAGMELGTGSQVEFAEGALVQGNDDPVYAVNYESGQIQKRHITSRSVFDDLGFSFDEVVEVSDDQLPAADGEDIDSSKIHPDGLLIREENDPQVYLLKDGQRRHVASREMFESHNFSFSNVRNARPDDMDLPEGDKVRFREGTLVQGDSDPVYVIAYEESQIRKRHIASRSVFDALDYSFSDVLDIPESQLPDTDGAVIK